MSEHIKNIVYILIYSEINTYVKCRCYSTMLQLHMWAGCVQAHAPKILSWCSATIGEKIRRKTRHSRTYLIHKIVGLGGGSRYLYPCHPSSRALLPWPCKLISATSVSLSTFVFRRRPTLRIGTRTSFVRWSPRNYGRFMALNEASIKNRQCLMEATCMLSKKECKFHQHQLYTGTLSRGDLLCDAHGLKSLKSLKRRYSKSGYIGPTNAYSCSTSSRLYCHISCSLAQAEPGA